MGGAVSKGKRLISPLSSKDVYSLSILLARFARKPHPHPYPPPPGLRLVKEFLDRVTAVKGVISKVKSWLRIGDAPGTPPPSIPDVLNELRALKTKVTGK